MHTSMRLWGGGNVCGEEGGKGRFMTINTGRCCRANFENLCWLSECRWSQRPDHMHQ